MLPRRFLVRFQGAEATAKNEKNREKKVTNIYYHSIQVSR